MIVQRLTTLFSKRNLNPLVVMMLVIIGVGLFKNIDYFPVPNPDVFQYIEDSQYYWSLEFPRNIHASPANPLLIGLLEKITPDFAFKEVRLAIGINIVAALAAAYLFWKISWQQIGSWAIFPFAMLLTHPVFYLVALNPTSEVLFASVTMAAFYSLLKKKTGWAYFWSAVSFLVRYEGLVVWLALVVVDLLKLPQNRKSQEFKVFLVNAGKAFAVMLFWTAVVLIYNNQQKIAGSVYFQEVMERGGLLPDWSVLESYPNAVFYSSYSLGGKEDWQHVIVYLLTIGGISLSLFQRKLRKENNYFWPSTFVFVAGYIIFHIGFPAWDIRYLFPIQFFGYLYCYLFLWNLWKVTQHKKKGFVRLIVGFIIGMLSLLTITNNFSRIEGLMSWGSEGYLENRLAASWLRKHYADKQALVITLQPWITSYYTDLPHLIFRLPVGYVGQQTFPCEDIDCIFRYTKAFDPNIDILLIRDNYTHAAGLNDFNAQNFGVGFLQNFLKEKQHYVLLDRVEQEKSWVEIYQYSPNFNWQQNLPKN